MASNNSLVPTQFQDTLDQEMVEVGVTDQQLHSGTSSQTSVTVGQARRVFNVNAENVMINAGRTLAGTLAHETLKMRISTAKKTFIPTESFKQVQRTLDQFGHVTISGASGEGKTTMSLMLAVDYMKKGYQVVFVEKVDAFDFNECVSSAHRLILIVDDIFGTVGLSTDISHLKNLLSSIQTHLLNVNQESDRSLSQTVGQNPHHTDQNQKDEGEEESQKDIRVVFTSKTYNFKNGISKLQYERLSMFTGHTVVDLTTDKHHRYSDREKIDIFQKHKTMHPKVKADGVSEHDLLNMDKLFGFPLTCRLFFEFSVFKSITGDFFKRPLFYLRIELNNILGLNNNHTAALILMLLCEDKLDLAKLEVQGRDKTMDEMFQHVTEIVPSATRQGTATAARHFRGTFFSGGDTLNFAHSSIHDACACAMYNFSPGFVLKYCSIEFLYERLKSGSVEEAKVSDHLHFLFISENYYDLMVIRLVEQVKKGHFSKTVTHPLLKHEEFAILFIKNFQIASNSENDTDWNHLKDKGKGILFWAVQGHSANLVYELINMFKITFSQHEIREALDGCVEKDNLVVLKFLFSKLEKTMYPSIHQILFLQCGENGSWEIAQYLMKEGINLKAFDEKRQNVIHLACKYEKTDMVKSFINVIGSLFTKEDYLSAITSIDVDGRTPAMLAAVCWSWDCFTLLSRDSNLDIHDLYGDSVIHYAAQYGNIDTVQHVLTSSNMNSRGKHGWTPVMNAAVSGHLSVFELLVSNNADLPLVDNYGDSVLHLACRGGNRDVVQHVLTPSNINSRGRYGRTPVMKAAVSGRINGVFELLVSNNADLTLVDDYGDSALHLACQEGNRDIVQHVLTSSNINSRGRHGWTPVMNAAVNCHLSVFELLVSNNADLTLVDDYGDSVLHLACRGGNRDIVQHVLTSSNINSRGRYGRTPVMKAGVGGRLNGVLELLVSNNADLTLVDDYGDSALHLACQEGNRYIVQHVLTSSNINSRGRHGWTPVMNAAVNDHLSVFELLVSNNADLTLVDDYGDSVLHLACRGGNRDIVQHVLTSSNINSRGRYGRTPVMKAAVSGRLNGVFELLASNNADLTLVDDYGDSVLHLACQEGNRDIVQHVLTSSNINSRGWHGWTPVMNATVNGHLSVFELLVSNNADITLVDDYGDSVLHLACRGGNRDIVQHVLTSSNINSRGWHGWTPVMNAAVNGHLSVFELLVSNNADITLVDDYGDSVLHLACRGGNRDIVQHVLTSSNINSRGENDWTALMVSAFYGHRNLIELLLENQANMSLVDNSGLNVIDVAQTGGKTDVANYLKNIH